MTVRRIEVTNLSFRTRRALYELQKALIEDHQEFFDVQITFSSSNTGINPDSSPIVDAIIV